MSQYCSGAAYLITPSLMPSFLKATGDVSPIPLDDIYMMGMVREYLGISPFYLNLRYTYELSRPYKWLKRENFQPLPFLFVVSDSKDKRYLYWNIVALTSRRNILFPYKQLIEGQNTRATEPTPSPNPTF